MGGKVAEIRFAGYGGQGIIRSAIIAGKAASIYDNKFSTMNQSFGPEARGGACSSQLVISESRVLYPYVTESDVFVAMSQEGYEIFEWELSEQGILLIDKDLVTPGPTRGSIQRFSVSATKIAEEMGNRIIANVVMLGFFTSATKLVSKEAMEKAITDSVPARFIELNLDAFNKGYNAKL